MTIDALRTSLSGRYTIVRELGAGGMATVYLAEDLKHHRQVAIKVLHAELSALLGPERFLKEIELTASLQHPHILPLFDSGSADGLLYYVMPYVDGETLRHRLERERQLPVADAIRIASEVADALQYAHARSVVHRDIKPENILLATGHALVSDFGIAFTTRTPAEQRLTEASLVLGTAAYMSPEQVMGDAPADGRTDVYSLGCVLYEMLTGAPPFVGTTAQAVMMKQVTQDPEPPTRNRDAIPAGVERSLLKALAKEPDARHGSAAEFAATLLGTQVAVRPSLVVDAPPDATIIVLPFQNASGDFDDACFSDGLADEVISDLSKVKAIRVTSRASSRRLRDPAPPLGNIAREFGVRYALSGSVRRAGDTLRIVAELVDATTGTSVWSDKYTGQPTDIFALQERLSRQIVDALRVAITPAESRRLARRPIDDVAVYRTWVTARELTLSYDPTAMERAQRLLYDELARSGENASLLAMLAMAHVQTVNVGGARDPAVLTTAAGHARRAIELDPDLAIGYVAMMYVEIWSRGAHAAIPWGRRGLERDRNGDTLAMAYLLAEAGVTIDDAVALSEELVARDPFAPLSWWYRSCVLLWSGDPDAAAAATDRLLALGWPTAELIAGAVRLQAGRYDDALRLFERVHPGDTLPVYAEFAPAFVQVIRTGRAPALSQELQDLCARAEPWAACWAASFHALAGDDDAAMHYARIAVQRGFTNVRWWTELDPTMARYRDTPAFRQIVADAARSRDGIVT